MKLPDDLPEWSDQKQTLRIMAGVELVAFKLPDAPWLMKVGRCNMCGKCCMNFRPEKHIFPVVEGRCIHLKKEVGNNPRWLCALSTMRPFGCSVGLGRDRVSDSICTEEFESI